MFMYFISEYTFFSLAYILNNITFLNNFFPFSCERLQVNDRILSINGMPIVGLSTDPQPLHKTPGIALGMVELSVEYDLQDTFVTVTDNLLTVDLTKHNKKNLGITMTGIIFYLNTHLCAT